MAKAAWLNASPMSGSGNKTISLSTAPYTGRLSRSTTLTLSASGATSQTVTVNQTGYGSILTANSTTVNVSKDGGTVYVRGTSNSLLLFYTIIGAGSTFDGVSGFSWALEGTSDENYISNGADIPGDPGASAAYRWTVVLEFTQNTDISAKEVGMVVEDHKGEQVAVTLYQAASDPVLTLNKTSLTLVAAGTAQTVTVTSNTSWTIS